jgi:hypothetical protein
VPKVALWSLEALPDESGSRCSSQIGC